jgi:hypothetical protein
MRSRGVTRALAQSVLAAACAIGVAGCAPELGGRASFPILSRAPMPGNYQPVATVDETRCWHQVLFFFGWGEDQSHEALVTDILAKYDGDAITHAELTYHAIPAILYNRGCARVMGTVVRKTAGPQAVEAPVSATPPPVATPPADAPPGDAQ